MNEEPNKTTGQPTDEQSCGCTCDACNAGNHDQCQTGMCTKKQPQASGPQENPPAA